VSRRRSERFTDAEFAALVPQEIAQARALYERGFIRQIWHRADVGGACIVVEAASESEVREQLNMLPLVRGEMLEVTIIPLKPYAGFCPAPVRH
jgi:muconolactone delta-isomerase